MLIISFSFKTIKDVILLILPKHKTAYGFAVLKGPLALLVAVGVA
jgi:hypothetical protein